VTTGIILRPPIALRSHKDKSGSRLRLGPRHLMLTHFQNTENNEKEAPIAERLRPSDLVGINIPGLEEYATRYAWAKTNASSQDSKTELASSFSVVGRYDVMMIPSRKPRPPSPCESGIFSLIGGRRPPFKNAALRRANSAQNPDFDFPAQGGGEARNACPRIFPRSKRRLLAPKRLI
jgi:hypothetical protein